VRKHAMAIFERYAKHRVRQRFEHRPAHFDCIAFGHRFNPSVQFLGFDHPLIQFRKDLGPASGNCNRMLEVGR